MILDNHEVQISKCKMADSLPSTWQILANHTGLHKAEPNLPINPLVSGLPKKYCQRICQRWRPNYGMDRIIYWPKLGHEYSCSLYLCKLYSFMFFFLSEVKLPRKIGFLSMNSSKVNSWRVDYSWRPGELHACIKWGIDTQMHSVNQITRNRIYLYEKWRYKTCIRSFNKLISTKIICWQLFLSGFLTLGS